MFKEHCRYIKTDADSNLLTKKGAHPYEYMNCVEKFNDTELPKFEDFYSKVSNKTIAEIEYEFAQHIWAHFNIKNGRIS